VGEVVGALVGEAVGALVGEAVGALVGEAVGALVGEAVGALVGEAVGVLVGGDVAFLDVFLLPLVFPSRCRDASDGERVTAPKIRRAEVRNFIKNYLITVVMAISNLLFCVWIGYNM